MSAVRRAHYLILLLPPSGSVSSAISDFNCGHNRARWEFKEFECGHGFYRKIERLGTPRPHLLRRPRRGCGMHVAAFFHILAGAAKRSLSPKLGAAALSNGLLRPFNVTEIFLSTS